MSVKPHTPARPDFLFIKVSISAGVRLSFSMMKGTMAGSMDPQRVPMTRPSSGVRPMLVSRHLPFFTQLMDEPLPRCMVMELSSLRGLPRYLAVALAMYLWEVPWKP